MRHLNSKICCRKSLGKIGINMVLGKDATHPRLVARG